MQKEFRPLALTGAWAARSYSSTRYSLPAAEDSAAHDGAAPQEALHAAAKRALHGATACRSWHPRCSSRPRPESMTRNNGPQTAPAAPRTSFELPEAEAFFAAGSGVGLCNRSPTWPRDAYYAFCTPLPVCCPTRNLCCSLSYNACCASSEVGRRFISPSWCPCGLCTCCFPLKVCDCCCACCKPPADRSTR